MGTLTKGFDARLDNRQFLVFDFLTFWRSTLSARVPERFRVFICSLSHAKKLFYRSANAIFGKIGRTASEEVVLQLIISKCIPVILYSLEACPLTKSDFAVYGLLR